MNEDATPRAEPNGGAYAWYVVGVLIVAYCFSFIDRLSLTLMVGPIRKSLQISDTQLSLLHGLAFAIFYTVMGVPIGRLVDHRRRTTIVAAGIAIWSVMTAACGLARSFGQLFLARIGVGFGEAALSPGAYSLISDYFPPQRRPLAMNLYIGAAYIGSGLALIIGGTLISMMPPLALPVVGQLEPWQGVFIAIGLPGLLVALWVLSLREPPRLGVAKDVPPHFSQVLRHMWQRRGAYLLTIVGYSLAGMMWNGAVAWLPEFFKRTFGWTTAETGWRYGLAMIVAGTLGAIFGGALATRMRSAGQDDANIRIGLVSLAISLPAGLIGTLSSSPVVALGGVAVFLFGCAMPYGGAAAALQEITPNQMRGQVSAIYLFGLSFFGLALGPTIVAFFTDHVFHNDAALGLSLACMLAIAAPLSALLLVLARRPYRLALAGIDF